MADGASAGTETTPEVGGKVGAEAVATGADAGTAKGADVTAGAEASLAACFKGFANWILWTPKTAGSSMSSTAKASFPKLPRRVVAVGARTSLKPCTSPSSCNKADALPVWPVKISLFP